MFRKIYAILVFIILSGSGIYAHGQAAQIQGQVLDASGAGIPKALIRLVDQQTSTERKTETNGAGQYVAPGLTPGIYKIIVEASGFSTAVSNAITVSVAQNAVLDFRLQVGVTSSEVTVNADNTGINTTDASVSTVVDRLFVENLPLNGRSFQSLLYLTPGVTQNNTASNSYYSQGQFIVNGQRGDASYWTVDGVSANFGTATSLAGAGIGGALVASNALGGTSALVSVDALQEFRFETSTYNPEFGRLPGGQIIIQTRSGTNQFHGALFEYLRNTVLDAADWFADHEGLGRAPEIQNDFGGVLGGPIFKDKTFFFFSTEGLRLRQPQTFLGTVPDLQSRAAAIPAMQPYINMFPLPKTGVADTPAGSGLAPYSATYSNPGSADAYGLRIDHHLLEHMNLFGRYDYAPSSTNQRAAYQNAANTSYNKAVTTKTATLGATWAPSGDVVDDFRLNYGVNGGKSFLNVDSFGGGTPFPSANILASGETYENSDILMINEFGTNTTVYFGRLGATFQHQYNLVDNLSVQKGPHIIKVGVDYRRLSPTVDNGNEQLLPVFDTLANFETGQSIETLTYLNGKQTFLLHNLGVFAQDTWRVTPRLNLTYGLRWDIDFIPTNTRGIGFAPALTGFSTTDLSNLGIAPVGTPPYHTAYGNVAPRIGGAYQISSNPDWGLVFRSGFGVMYGLASTEIFNENYHNAYYPVGAYNTFYTPGAYVPFPTPPDVAALPVIQPPNIENGEILFGFDPHLNVPYALEWSAALEQSLGKQQTLGVSYVGASDKRLLLSESITNPNPRYASAVLVGNIGTSNYQALQLQFQRHLANGLQALVSYTWSHSIDTGSYGQYENGSFATVGANRGDSDFDVRNSLSGALTYSIPAMHTNSFTRAVTGGWSTDDTIQIHSGPPIDVQDANFTALSLVNSSVLIRPDVVSGEPRYLTGSQYPGGKALNPGAFTDPPVDPVTQLPTRQGNLPRNASRTLGLAQVDFAARRDFSIYERMKLQFRAELFNAFNHPNFGPFNNMFQTDNALFGQATQMFNQYAPGNAGQNPLYIAGGPRSGELVLKFVF